MIRPTDADAQTLLYRNLSSAVTGVVWDPTSFADGMEPFSNYRELILGDSDDNILNGTTGDDMILAFGGNDILIGGEGEDIINGGLGLDTMLGGNGNDIYHVDLWRDVVLDSEIDLFGYDIIYTQDSYTLAEDAMIEELRALDINSPYLMDLIGASRNETLEGNATGNILLGLAGNDSLIGNGGDDRLEGGAGQDTLDSGAGADTMIGGAENDIYVVTDTGEVIIEYVGGGTDTVNTGVSFTLGTTKNLENLKAMEGFYVSFLRGNDDDNVIEGNSGVNRLIGDDGRDEFILDITTKVDRIADFSASDDTIRLNSTKLLPNQFLKSEQFVLGVYATEIYHRVIYDPSTGFLYFDADGRGATYEKTRIAILENKPTDLSANDFFIAG